MHSNLAGNENADLDMAAGDFDGLEDVNMVSEEEDDDLGEDSHEEEDDGRYGSDRINEESRRVIDQRGHSQDLSLPSHIEFANLGNPGLGVSGNGYGSQLTAGSVGSQASVGGDVDADRSGPVIHGNSGEAPMYSASSFSGSGANVPGGLFDNRMTILDSQVQNEPRSDSVMEQETPDIFTCESQTNVATRDTVTNMFKSGTNVGENVQSIECRDESKEVLGSSDISVAAKSSSDTSESNPDGYVVDGSAVYQLL